jgi:hypothetical protein
MLPGLCSPAVTTSLSVVLQTWYFLPENRGIAMDTTVIPSRHWHVYHPCVGVVAGAVSEMKRFAVNRGGSYVDRAVYWARWRVYRSVW